MLFLITSINQNYPLFWLVASFWESDFCRVWHRYDAVRCRSSPEITWCAPHWGCTENLESGLKPTGLKNSWGIIRDNWIKMTIWLSYSRVKIYHKYGTLISVYISVSHNSSSLFRPCRARSRLLFFHFHSVEVFVGLMTSSKSLRVKKFWRMKIGEQVSVERIGYCGIEGIWCEAKMVRRVLVFRAGRRVPSCEGELVRRKLNPWWEKRRPKRRRAWWRSKNLRLPSPAESTGTTWPDTGPARWPTPTDQKTADRRRETWAG